MKNRVIQSCILIFMASFFGIVTNYHQNVLSNTSDCREKTAILADEIPLSFDVADDTINLYAGIEREIYGFRTSTLNTEDNSNTDDGEPVCRKEYVGYSTGNVNVREQPTTESDIVTTLNFNDEVIYIPYDDNWGEYIKDGESIGYVCTDYLSETMCSYTEYTIPQTTGFKSYMSYKAITSKGSQQYKLQRQYAYSGKYGIRMVNGRYCVALGSYFDVEIGQYFDLILEDGEVIPCILADVKDDKHTDNQNLVTVKSGCMSEFIVDTSVLKSSSNISGDISDCCDEWDSPVVKVIIYNKGVF